MKNKNGFTLIELIVSIVLVSIVMTSLLATLIKIRETYTIIHENSDVIVFSSSAARIINNDLNLNGGIRYASCNNSDNKECDLILGGGQNRKLRIVDKIIDTDTSTANNTGISVVHKKVQSTLTYYDSTRYERSQIKTDLDLLYIKTLELDRYESIADGSENAFSIETSGYNFYTITAEQKQYPSDSNNKVDVITTVIISIYDGKDTLNINNAITLYTSGKFDNSRLQGNVYNLEFFLEPESFTGGVSSIDVVYGVGFFKSGTNHKKSDMITSLNVPISLTGEAFEGYYYINKNSETKTRITDSSGKIVASSRLFDHSISADDTDRELIVAEWINCTNGYEIINNICSPKTFTVTLKRESGSIATLGSYSVKYKNKVKDLSSIPSRSGYIFTGYYDSNDKMYHDNKGIGKIIYSETSDTTLYAGWERCLAGTYSFSNKCNMCAIGSYSPSTSNICTACDAGTTTPSAGSSRCSSNCQNSSGVLEWETPIWDSDSNTVKYLCTIKTCSRGYTLKNNECIM